MSSEKDYASALLLALMICGSFWIVMLIWWLA